MSKDQNREEETSPARRTYSPAEAAADLEHYVEIKRMAGAGTLLVVAIPALVLAAWFPWYAIALAAGGLAGVANTLLSMYGNEKLLERGSVAAFVLSSFVRIALFGIVPVVLALRAPSLWTLGCYFAGFFTPLGISVGLTCKRK